MIIEVLARNTFDKKNQDFGKCESDWKTDSLYTIDFVEKMMKSTRDTLAMTRPEFDSSEFEWSNVYSRLLAGKVVEDIMVFYRVKTEDKKCPLCGSSIKEGLAAISRRDNKTEICNDCGVVEGLKDYAGLR